MPTLRIAAQDLRCRRAPLRLGACPGGRRSLPLPPFRQSGFRSFGIGPHSFIVSTRFLRRTGRPSPGDAKAKANPMIDLYALTSPNVQKVYIMLEECALPYKEHFVDVWKGDQYGPEFSKINPNNKIPAIVDHEGPGGKPLYGDRVGRDPDVSGRKDRKVSAQGHGQEVRRDAVADDPAHRRRADVRPVDPFQAVRAEDRQRLFDGPLHLGDQAAVRAAGEAAGRRRPISAARSIPSPTSRPSRGPATTTPRA